MADNPDNADKVGYGSLGHPMRTSSSASRWAYGTWPQYKWGVIANDGAVATTNGLAVYTSGDISIFNHHEFTIASGAGADTIDVTVSHDGTTYESASLSAINRVDGAADTPAAMANTSPAGNYYIKGRFKKMKITQTGASITTGYTVRGSHTVV